MSNVDRGILKYLSTHIWRDGDTGASCMHDGGISMPKGPKAEFFALYVRRKSRFGSYACMTSFPDNTLLIWAHPWLSTDALEHVANHRLVSRSLI